MVWICHSLTSDLLKDILVVSNLAILNKQIRRKEGREGGRERQSPCFLADSTNKNEFYHSTQDLVDLEFY